MLEGSPVQGQAALLLRLYQWYPVENALHPRFSWGHFQVFLQLYDQEVRSFYQRCALAGHWTVGQLRRQVRTYWHLRRKALKASEPHADVQLPTWLPDPLVLEYTPNDDSTEAELEAAIVDHLAVFLLELGQELSFVARQMRLITFSGLQMVIDLVFYHHRAQHFVLFELKNAPLSAGAVGQLQSYLQFFDDCWKNPQDAPSVGVILCTQVDPALQRYSALRQSTQLFAVRFVPAADFENPNLML